MSYKYMIVCPRGFENEINVYRVENTPEMIEAANEWMRECERESNQCHASWEWVTRKRAEKQIATNRRRERTAQETGTRDYGSREIEDWTGGERCAREYHRGAYV